MLNADDPQTKASLNRLRRIVTENSRPVVIWLGAGTSKWAGLPTWKELARSLHRAFRKECSSYDVNAGASALSDDNFPLEFQLCSDADPALYRRVLVDKLRNPPTNLLYKRFTNKLQEFQPLLLLTTNADSLLEQSISSLEVLQRSDFERFIPLSQQRSACIAKLHGSVSAVDSLIFTNIEYDRLMQDQTYSDTLKTVFATSSVIFLGYGLRDQYVLDLMHRQAGTQRLFGSGPHFQVTYDGELVDDSVYPIRYSTVQGSDHRGAMALLDYMQQAKLEAVRVIPQQESSPARESAFYITEFHAPGTHNTSQMVALEKVDSGLKQNMTIGLGWSLEDRPDATSHALHDLLVGLLCFDRVYLALKDIDSLMRVAGEAVVRELLLTDSLRLLHTEAVPNILFAPGEVMGSLGMAKFTNPGSLESPTADIVIRRYIKPTVGREMEFEAWVCLLLRQTNIISADDVESTPWRTRSSLLMPRVASMLGFGDAVMPSQVPFWLRFPILRMAHLVETSHVCQTLGILSTRLPFGGAALVSAAFGIVTTGMFADQYASYVLSGRLQNSLNGFMAQSSETLRRVLRFRESHASAQLRKHVLDSLSNSNQDEFGPAIDAGLRQAIGPQILENARTAMDTLLLADGSISTTPAVWTSPDFENTATRNWRDVARKNLLELLRARGETTKAKCLCGSGDAVSDCCLRALRN